jgi:hypothetical protein
MDEATARDITLCHSLCNKIKLLGQDARKVTERQHYVNITAT